MNAIDNSARVEACEEVKQKIVCTINFNAYFEQDEIGGKSLTVIDIGVCDFPTGSVVASDPFEFLSTKSAVRTFKRCLSVDIEPSFALSNRTGSTLTAMRQYVCASPGRGPSSFVWR